MPGPWGHQWANDRLLAVDNTAAGGLTTVDPATVGGGGGAPTGAMLVWPTDTPPSGWLLCDGAAVSRTTYSDLFDLIGETFGAGDGSSTFELPNLTGRIPVGFDAGDTDFDTLGETGGAKTTTLTTSELPAHTHDVTDPGHVHVETINANASGGSLGWTRDTSTNTAATSGYSTESATTGLTVDSAGSGAAFSRMPPYLAVNWIIKT